MVTATSPKPLSWGREAVSPKRTKLPREPSARGAKAYRVSRTPDGKRKPASLGETVATESEIRAADPVSQSPAGCIDVSYVAFASSTQNPNVGLVLPLPRYAKFKRTSMQNPDSIRCYLDPQRIQVAYDTREGCVRNGYINELIGAQGVLDQEGIASSGEIGIVALALVPEAEILRMSQTRSKQHECCG